MTPKVVHPLKLKRISIGKGRTRLHGISRGMIFWVKLDLAETVGEEQHSDEPRPWVVVSANALHANRATVQATPLTKHAHQARSMPAARVTIPQSQILIVPATGQPKMKQVDSIALADLTRALAHDRLQGDGPIARVTDQAMYDLDAALAFVFDMS